MGGFAFANKIGGETGSGLGINFHLRTDGIASLGTDGDRAVVGSCHSQGAVADGGILLVGSETVGSRPMISGSRLSIGG